MRSGGPLKRTPLKRGKPLTRRTSLKPKSAPKKTARASTGPGRDVVDAVYGRSGHSCEACGLAVGPVRGVDHHIHHRRPRAMGGTDRADSNQPPNLMLLDPGCHSWIESHRTDALLLGWLVHQSEDPALVPTVVIHCPRPVFLTVDGRYCPALTEKGLC